MPSMIELQRFPDLVADERELLGRLNPERLPRHVAVIMDGNGRWARERFLPRVAGHRAGIESVRATVETAAQLGLECLTLYAFSHENWKRPRLEVSTLMSLLREYIIRERETLLRNDIRFRFIGRTEQLPARALAALTDAVRATAHCRGLTFTVALSYGGRQEIVDAARALLRDGVDADALDEAQFESRLYTAGMPDPDLLIRTSGELRVSNFLLWQIAYAEIWVTQTLWPDFRRRHLFEAIEAYGKRDRRFGRVAENVANPATEGKRS